MWSGSDSEVAGAGRYMAYSPSPSNAPPSPHLSTRRSASILEQEKYAVYLAELLAERQNIGPFMPVLPLCYRLLYQEILRVTNLLGNTSVIGQSGFEHANPLAFGGLHSSGGADMNRWQSRFQTEEAQRHSN